MRLQSRILEMRLAERKMIEFLSKIIQEHEMTSMEAVAVLTSLIHGVARSHIHAEEMMEQEQAQEKKES